MITINFFQTDAEATQARKDFAESFNSANFYICESVTNFDDKCTIVYHWDHPSWSGEWSGDQMQVWSIDEDGRPNEIVADEVFASWE